MHESPLPDPIAEVVFVGWRRFVGDPVADLREEDVVVVCYQCHGNYHESMIGPFHWKGKLSLRLLTYTFHQFRFHLPLKDQTRRSSS
jgi:hypothetical protein